jgi:hypothetical protein
MATDEITQFFEKYILRNVKCKLHLIILYIRLCNEDVAWRGFVSCHPHLSRKLMIFVSQFETFMEQKSALVEYSFQWTIELCKKLDLMPNICWNGVACADSSFLPFSISPLWTVQNSFYAGQSLTAWDVVPFQISSNRYVSRLYVDHIQEAWEVAHPFPQHQSSPPVVATVVEIGAGHGVLSFLIAMEMRRVSMPYVDLYINQPPQPPPRYHVLYSSFIYY